VKNVFLTEEVSSSGMIETCLLAKVKIAND